MSAPWKQRLTRSLHLSRSKPEAKYFQLATVGLDGMPDNRTVVFRGFSDESDGLLVVTDTRSEKFTQLQRNPAACVVWYFTKSREQYRFKGNTAILIDAQTDTTNVVDTHNEVITKTALTPFWSSLSAGTRSQFYWPHPGREVTEDEPSNADIDVLSPYFSVLRIVPTEVQFLDLKASPQQRESYTWQEANWHVKQINP
ncbi:pyridoxamine 5'-phosphate oxidase family protein [Aestuariibacter salexigens]|uniref:pyridoxamine 5'-phosphate oxidase family protein n=1 Tax=Aestuariibacter salexigens TaxID=226010 RepID=UPI00042646EC|nr:pyridoxamine 5'-phosphate oxidase family protein [Aestuariibacter salexigens]